MTSSDSNLSHIGPDGHARMVDVGGKDVTTRRATAEAWVDVGPAIAARLRDTGAVDKGPVLGTAELAGVLGAKQTPHLIPLCHPLLLSDVQVHADLGDDNRIRIEATVACDGRTGVEMEALTACSIAALTVYDMVKSAAKGVTIGPIRLLSKTGGKSGPWRRPETPAKASKKSTNTKHKH